MSSVGMILQGVMLLLGILFAVRPQLVTKSTGPEVRVVRIAWAVVALLSATILILNAYDV